MPRPSAQLESLSLRDDTGVFMVTTMSGTIHRLAVRKADRPHHQRFEADGTGRHQKPRKRGDTISIASGFAVGSQGYLEYADSSYLYGASWRQTATIESIVRAPHTCVRCGWPCVGATGWGCPRCVLLGRDWWNAHQRPRVRLWRWAQGRISEAKWKFPR